jgi:t-SNARE complex subunit (syntaxin)
MKTAQQQLTELQDRHDEFLKLEKSIREVHDIFIEIANLVTQQVR